MRVFFLGICVNLLLSISYISSHVTIENGGFNVLVAISQNVPFETGVEIIGRIEMNLRKASEVLHNAIGLQFSKVTIEIPDSWNVSDYNIIDEESFNNIEADILIDNAEDTVFGKFPFAQQYGSCGVQGHQIIVPTAFFDVANPFPKGISLAREWLKYRYGVFDENGYFGDFLYPVYYNIPGSNANEVRVTDCLNSEIAYNFTDQIGEECPTDEKLIEKLNSNECVLNVEENDLESITSSLMYFQKSITNMTHICGKDDDHQHNSRSPSKQNTLCFGKSIWDVVSQSSDFKNTKIEEEHTDVKFVLTKKAKPRVVLAWENTDRLKSQGQIILNAITKLMIDLPDGSKFNALPFPFKENAPSGYFTLKHLDGVEKRQTIASEIKSDFAKPPEDVNYKDIFNTAYKVLQDGVENNENPPGNIIILTALEDNLTVILLKDLNVCYDILLDDDFPGVMNELISEQPCLEVVKVPLSEKPEKTYETLIQTLERIFPDKVEDRLSETLKIGYVKENKALDVQVDDLTKSVTFSIFGDREGQTFRLKLNDAIMEANKEESYKNVLRLHYYPMQAGTINFSYRYPVTEPTLVEVKKTSKAGQYFSGEILVHETIDEEVPSSDQTPVIIYAIIRFGSYPVQNAYVSAEIQRPDGEKIMLNLNDDGRGDPDITKNDGVYSHYFTQFSGEGEYTVTVLATNSKQSRKGADKSAGYNSCCGSAVNGEGSLTNGDTTELNEFTKLYVTTFRASGGRPEDGYKPSRITDLRIDKLTDDGIILKWTAPGAEADSGTVQSYQIKSFTSPEDAKNNFDGGNELFNYTSPEKEMGETEQLNIKYDAFEGNGKQFIAMKAKNSKKESALSTIVEVYITNQEATDAPDNGGGDKDNIKAAKTSPKTIGLIVGLIVGLILLLILIYVVIYFVIVKPKRKKQNKDNPIYESSTKRVDNNALNPISFVSADTLIKHHNEKVKAKTQNKESPIFKEEDFQDRNIQHTNDSSTGSNDRERQSRHKDERNGEPFPPKSPKRITPV